MFRGNYEMHLDLNEKTNNVNKINVNREDYQLIVTYN